MAQELWAQQSVGPWAKELANLHQQTSHCPDTNNFYEEVLPSSIASRAPDGRHITQPELVQLVEWKLARGKWRPRLLDYAKSAQVRFFESAQAQEVEAASRQAFSLLLKGSDATDAAAAGGGSSSSSGRKRPAATLTAAAGAAAKKQKQLDGSSEAAAAAEAAADASPAGPAEPTAAAAAAPVAGAPPGLAAVQAALDALTVIKGVGPATASALLAAADSSVPFMSDEALTAALGRRDYTAKAYLQLLQQLRAKADWLNQQSPGSGWTAVLVERCLHAAALAARPPPKAAAAAAGKNKKNSAPARKKK